MLSKLILWLQSLVRRPSQYSPTELNQRKRVRQTLDYYEGNQLQWLSDVLSAQFSNPTALKMQLEISNVVAYITDNLCRTFKNGIVIKSSIPTEQPIWDEMLDCVQFDAFMQEVEKKTFLCKTAFVKVSWLEMEQELSLSIITPEYVEVSPEIEEPYEIASIIYPIELAVSANPYVNNEYPVGLFAYWDNETFKVVNERTLAVPQPGNPSRVNPYGIVPVAVFRESIPSNGKFWAFPGEDLINGQDTINVLLTSRNQLVKFQSFSQAVITNPSTDIYGNKQVNVDPSTPIIFTNADKDSPSKFEFVSPSARIIEVQEIIDREYIKTIGLYGLSPDDFVSSKERRSADGIIVSNIKVDEYRKEQKLVYTPQILELLEIMRVVWNTHAPSNKQLTEDTVTVQILDPSLRYISVTEKWLDYGKKMELGLITPVDILVMESDDLTPDEALERIGENKDVMAELAGDIEEMPEDESTSEGEQNASSESEEPQDGQGGIQSPQE
jgi:hypothetical protein